MAADRRGTRLTDDNSIPTLAQPRFIKCTVDGKGRTQANGNCSRVLHIGKMVQKRARVDRKTCVCVEMRCA
jgi:hypothetical protein